MQKLKQFLNNKKILIGIGITGCIILTGTISIIIYTVNNSKGSNTEDNVAANDISKQEDEQDQEPTQETETNESIEESDDITGDGDTAYEEGGDGGFPEEEPTQEKPPQEIKYLKYTNTKYLYSIDYPSHWEIENGVGEMSTTSVQTLFKSQNYFDPPAFYVYNTAETKELCEAIFDPGTSGGTVSFEKGTETINGITFLTSTAKQDDPSMNMAQYTKKYQYWDSNSMICYEIATLDGLEHEYKSMLDHIINSFKIN